jgi:DNA-binding CsgD family transcriptional regulator
VSVFVGRDREREQLAAVLRTASAGAARVVLVSGEPGVGKTRLAAEAAAVARGLGMAHATGRATDDDGSPPLAAVRQVLRAIGSPDPLTTQAAAGERAEAAAQERFRRQEAVTEALTAAAATRGLFVLLDDLQWADALTLQVLVHLARTLGPARVAVVATYRSTDTAGRAALRAALGTLASEPAVERIRLTGLSEPEVNAQLEAVAGFTVPACVAAAVHRRTGGNPFFVGELGRLLSAAEVTDEKGLPDGVRDAVAARIARLSPAGGTVVRAAAVLGTALDPAALAAATGVDLPDVLAVLDEAAGAGIVADGGFTHDLVRESAALDVGTAERMALHARMAAHLTGRSDAGTRAAEVAHHLIESLPTGDAAAAVTWSRRAGDWAMAQLAWEQAAAWYGRALDAATGDELTPAQRAALLTDRARAQVRGYDIDGARRSLLAAADIGRAAGDGEVLARAVLVMEGVSDFLWDPVGRSLAVEALVALPTKDSDLRARLLAGTVVMESWRMPEDSAVRSMAALEMAERVGDRRALVEALRARQFACSGPEGAEERLGLGDRLLAIGLDGDDDATLWGHLWRFDAYAQLGEMAAVAAEADALEALAARMRSPLVRWHAIRSRATLDAAQGRFGAALAAGDQVIELARRSGNDGSIVPSIGFVVAVRSLLGELDPLPEETAFLNVDHATATGLRGMLARAHLAIGDTDAAAAYYRELPGIDQVPPFVRLPAAAGLIELAAAFGDRHAVEEIYAALLPYAHRFVCGGAGVIIIEGSARLPLGIGAAALDRLDDAVDHLRAAIDAGLRQNLPPAVATARYHLAKTLLRRGDTAEAAALTADAVAQAEALGMRPLRTAAAALVPGRQKGPLTRREQEIAELVARGLTSRAIATDLYLSERTVETHVQHILTKLGLSNRTQIATWVAGLRTTGT